MFSRFFAFALITAASVSACVTINVYFPAAAAEQAADRIIQDVLGEPRDGAGAVNGDSTGARHGPPLSLPAVDPAVEIPAEAPMAQRWLAATVNWLVPPAQAQNADIDISTPQVKTITQRMAQRQQQQLAPFFSSGAIGFGNDGLVKVRDRTAVGLAQRRQLESLVAEENNDRKALYREIAVANGHPEWEDDIRNTFAQRWVANAPKGWFYQNANGSWVQK